MRAILFEYLNIQIFVLIPVVKARLERLAAVKARLAKLAAVKARLAILAAV